MVKDKCNFKIILSSMRIFFPHHTCDMTNLTPFSSTKFNYTNKWFFVSVKRNELWTMGYCTVGFLFSTLISCSQEKVVFK